MSDKKSKSKPEPSSKPEVKLSKDQRKLNNFYNF